MKYTGTIFQGWGVKAILEGRKTQTRRVIKPQPVRVNDAFDGTWDWKGHLYDDLTLAMTLKDNCPYGQVGDRLWVRETHYRWGRWVPNGFSKTGKQKWTFRAGTSEVLYIDNPPTLNVLPNSRHMERGWFKRPSIFMPRSASRITLELTGVKVERVQDISPQDIEREGLTPPSDSLNWVGTFQNNFRLLWDSINAKRGFGWDVNPWDLALTFKVVNGKS